MPYLTVVKVFCIPLDEHVDRNGERATQGVDGEQSCKLSNAVPLSNEVWQPKRWCFTHSDKHQAGDSRSAILQAKDLVVMDCDGLQAPAILSCDTENQSRENPL